MLAAADKEFERVQHTEIYLSGLKLQYKTKFKLPLDTISKHVFSYLQLPDYPPPPPINTYGSGPYIFVLVHRRYVVFQF